MSYQSNNIIILEFGQYYTKVGLGFENTPVKLLKTYKHFNYDNISIVEEDAEDWQLGVHNRAERFNDLHDYIDDIFYKYASFC